MLATPRYSVPLPVKQRWAGTVGGMACCEPGPGAPPPNADPARWGQGDSPMLQSRPARPGGQAHTVVPVATIRWQVPPFRHGLLRQAGGRRRARPGASGDQTHETGPGRAPPPQAGQGRGHPAGRLWTCRPPPRSRPRCTCVACVLALDAAPGTLALLWPAPVHAGPAVPLLHVLTAGLVEAFLWGSCRESPAARTPPPPCRPPSPSRGRTWPGPAAPHPAHPRCSPCR